MQDGNSNDRNKAGALLHGDEQAAFGDAAQPGGHKKPEAHGPAWYVAMRRALRRKLSPFIEPDFVAEGVEKMKVGIRVKVEQPVCVVEQQFEFTRGGAGGVPRTRRSCSLFPTCG